MGILRKSIERYKRRVAKLQAHYEFYGVTDIQLAVRYQHKTPPKTRREIQKFVLTTLPHPDDLSEQDHSRKEYFQQQIRAIVEAALRGDDVELEFQFGADVSELQQIERRSEPKTKRRSIPKAVQREVWRRDQGRCVVCGRRGRLEYDHIIPVSKGGSYTARNIELRCETCNRKKGAKIGG